MKGDFTMKSKKLTRRILALIVVMAVTVVFSLQAFASIWYFGDSGSGSNPFAPRGYSITVSNTEKWLDIDYFDHDGALSGSQIAVSYTYPTNPSENETSSVGAGTYSMKAWFDKNPKGTTFPSQVGKTYKDFLVVSIDGGSYVPINSLSGSPYYASVGNADRNSSVKDPDNYGNQWYVPITLTLQEDEEYSFAFLQGIQANNGNTLVIYPGTTTTNLSGYVGYVSADDNAHLSYYSTSGVYDALYQFADITGSLGYDANNHEVKDVDLVDFEHVVSAY